MTEFIGGSINYLVLELGDEFEIALTDGGQLNFDKFFLHFNVKKKISKSYSQFDCKYWILDTASLNNKLIGWCHNANFNIHITFLNEKNKILQDVKESTLLKIPL